MPFEGLMWPGSLARKSAAFVLVLTFSGCDPRLCVDLDALGQQTLGADRQAIVGGTVDDQNRSTVALVVTLANGSTGVCSGSVIAVRGDVGWVLTAAHCLSGTVEHVFEATDWRDCWEGALGCGDSYTPLSSHVHPAYDAEAIEHDFGLVQIQGTHSGTAFTPVAGSADGLEAGDFVELSGFGRTYAGIEEPDAFQTERHRVTVSLASVTVDWLRIDATTGKTACFGDSGGPAFAHVGGARVVVGVASNADATCEHVANYGRVASVYETFIAPQIERGRRTPCDECGGGDAAGGAGGAALGGGSSAEGGGFAEEGGGGAAAGGGESSADPGEDVPTCVPLSLECGVTQPSHARRTSAASLLLLALASWARRRSARR